MMNSVRKDYQEKIASDALGPQDEQEKEAVAGCLQTMMRALPMYQQAEADLIQCHQQLEVTIAVMKLAMKEAPQEQQPGLQQHVDTMEGFRDQKKQTIKEVQATIAQMDEKLAKVV